MKIVFLITHNKITPLIVLIKLKIALNIRLMIIVWAQLNNKLSKKFSVVDQLLLSSQYIEISSSTNQEYIKFIQKATDSQLDKPLKLLDGKLETTKNAG